LDTESRGWRDGLLADVTRLVVEAALEAELAEHLRANPGTAGSTRRTGGNCRNGTRRKTVATIAGPVTVDAPRDRLGTFQPVTVGKWQRRVVGVDQLVLPLAAAGTSTDDTVALLTQGYAGQLERQVLVAMAARIRATADPWHQRPLPDHCLALLLGRAAVRSRALGFAAPPVHTAVAVATDGTRELVGLWRRPSDGQLTAWWQYLRALRGRGLRGPQSIVTPALPGVVDEVAAIWPRTAVHLRAGDTGDGTRPTTQRVR
jgi:transposase-like protein